MFFKKKLILNILNVATANVFSYKEELKNIIKENNNDEEEISGDKLEKIRIKYLKKVYADVKDLYKNEKRLYDRIIEIEKNPSIIDYDGILDGGFLGGTIFAIIYFAKKGRFALPGECIFLNHKTNDIMMESLTELDNELKK